jgi:hypothetical protein
MAVATFKHKIAFDTSTDVATLRLPAEYDIIQIQLHITGTADAGDLLLIQGLDEDGDLVTLPGGTGAADAFLFTGDKVLQFTWKGLGLKFTYTESGAGITAAEVKVKTFNENPGDADTGREYESLAGDAAPGNTRSLRGA